MALCMLRAGALVVAFCAILWIDGFLGLFTVLVSPPLHTAILDALRLIATLGFPRVIIESDSAVAIQFITRGVAPSHPLLQLDLPDA